MRYESMLAGRGFQVVENPGFSMDRDPAETVQTTKREVTNARTLVAGTKRTSRKSSK